MPRRRRTHRSFVRELAHEFSEHRLFIYATSLGFRALIAVIPLVLLALGLLGAFGLRSTWRKSIAPEIRPHVTPPVFHAIDYSAEKILHSGTAPLILFASALVIWDLTLALAAIMEALNRIHEVEEKRSFVRRALTALVLAVVSGVCLVGSILILSAAPRARGDVTHFVLGVGRWLVGALLLMFVVAIVMRFAPAERPEKRWASVGSILVIAVWIVASLLFKLWVQNVADFKSATGSLTVLLFLSWYVFVSSAIFLVGAQVDELLRRETARNPSRLLELIHGRTSG
ncbi:MAG: YihY/virulence factor BrkB family protein [Actinobacteria bacterium]|nr:MAG: YihY/virulence factor BrkB family protein [Actinomycetota bacterium]